MTYETGYFPENTRLYRERMLRHLTAFVVSACASFVLLSLIWPLTVKGFRSSTYLAVRVGSAAGAQQEFQSLLATAIRVRVTDECLNNLLAQVRRQSTLKNQALVSNDFETIRQSLSFRALPGTTPDTMRVDLAIRGIGGPDEHAFIQLLSSELASSMVQVAEGSDIQSELAIESEGSAQQRQNVAQLDRLVSQLEDNLAIVRGSLANLPANKPNSSPFQSVSHSSNDPSRLIPLDVEQALTNIDVSSLRTQWNELKSNLDSEISNVGAIPPAGGRLSSVPIDGVPSRSQIMMLAILAAAMGSVVAFNYRPFAARGFANVGRLTALLRIPVVATLPATAMSITSASMETNSPGVPWANWVVQGAKAVLFGLLLLVIGFCLVNQEVRRAFLENPFHGFTKMVWVFVGY